jgi:hypothetical protein
LVCAPDIAVTLPSLKRMNQDDVIDEDPWGKRGLTIVRDFSTWV